MGQEQPQILAAHPFSHIFLERGMKLTALCVCNNNEETHSSDKLN